MQTKLIDGKALSLKIRKELTEQVKSLKEQRGIVPGLAVVLVGDDSASKVYVRNKETACEEAGIKSIVYRMCEQTTKEELFEVIDKLNSDKNIHGILIQLPLPKHLSEREAISHIDPNKDVDGLHVISIGRFMSRESSFTACTPMGIISLIKSTGMDIKGKNAVVIGRSNIVGKPVAMLLLNENATVTICHSKTQNLSEICSRADILVAAIGKSEFVRGNFIKEGAVVIDVGINRVDGKLKGDVCMEEALGKAAYITPVPGGVGPMTITMLIKNTILAGEMNG